MGDINKKGSVKVSWAKRNAQTYGVGLGVCSFQVAMSHTLVSLLGILRKMVVRLLLYYVAATSYQMGRLIIFTAHLLSGRVFGGTFIDFTRVLYGQYSVSSIVNF